MVLDCEQALTLISAALDGELSPDEELALKEHLAHCPACRELSNEFAILSVALSDMIAPPPEKLPARIHSTLVSGKIHPRRSKPLGTVIPWKAWGALAAAVAVVLCLHMGRWFASMAGESDRSTAEAEAGMVDDGNSGSDSGGYSSSPDPAPAGDSSSQSPESALDQSQAEAASGQSDSHVENDTTEDYSALESPAPFSLPAPSEPAPEPADAPMERMSESSPLLHALDSVFQFLGGLDAYPNAQLERDDSRYLLESSENGSKYLACEGLSPNGQFYLFQVFLLPPHTEIDANSQDLVTQNRYALSLDESSLLNENENPSAFQDAIGSPPA